MGEGDVICYESARCMHNPSPDSNPNLKKLLPKSNWVVSRIFKYFFHNRLQSNFISGIPLARVFYVRIRVRVKIRVRVRAFDSIRNFNFISILNVLSNPNSNPNSNPKSTSNSTYGIWL
jgi:hypothetical protein